MSELRDSRSSSWYYERGTEEFSRLLAFTDGVVAIALTLLVLNLDLPQPSAGDDESVFEAIAGLGDQFFAFLLSFVLIGFYWLRHHRFIAGLKAIDGSTLLWSLGYLLAIVLVPFAAEVIGFYAGEPDAVAVYASWFILFGVLSTVGYLAAVHRGLTTDQHEPTRIRAEVGGRLVAPAVFLVSIPIAYLVSGGAAMWSWLLIWPLSLALDRLWPRQATHRPTDPPTR